MHMTEFSFIYPNFARINFPKIMNRILYILGIAMSILTLASCNDNIPQPDEKLKGNTVIVYMGAENSLQKFSYYDLQEMQMGMQDIPENCQVVVYRDAELKPSIFLLNRKGITTWKEYKSDMDSADPAIMENILKDIVKGFPSEKYSLVLWSHGTGWIDETRNSRAIIVDNENNSTSNKGNWIEISELSNVLASLPHMEYILFDACYMQSVEVASQLYRHASYIIGSPTEIPGDGAPYHLIMEALCKANPQDIIEGYSSGYRNGNGVLLSAVSCADIPDFCAETAKYIPSAFSKDNMPKTPGIQIYAPAYGNTYNTQNAMPVPYDMRSAMHRALSQDDFAAWEMAWKKTILYPTWANSWDTVYSPGTHGNFHCTMQDENLYGGISMNIPDEKYDSKGWNRQFQDTEWYKTTSWEQTGW